MRRNIVVVYTVTVVLGIYFFDPNKLLATKHQLVNIVANSTLIGSMSGSSFCFNEGSQHHIAIEMMNYSSPVGSPSYKKLLSVLRTNSDFYMDLGPNTFEKNDPSISRILHGYGLTRTHIYSPNTTLVETAYSRSTCPLTSTKCQTQARILIQSEQYFKPPVKLCHDSPTCVVFEFSDHNYRKAQAIGFGGSFVLLPVMTQDTSRLEAFLPQSLKPLKERNHDIVFFATITPRRKPLQQQKDSYLQVHPNISITIENSRDYHHMAKVYSDAKVCLVAHAYDWEAGGEYHRLSEVAPFGCIFVVEQISDQVGINKYQQCGGVHFTDFDHLLSAGGEVVAKINAGFYDNFLYLDWWQAGIQWESLLPTLFSAEEK